jgi:hypothetical protein
MVQSEVEGAALKGSPRYLVTLAKKKRLGDAPGAEFTEGE